MKNKDLYLLWMRNTLIFLGYSTTFLAANYMLFVD